jgi:hypothetical protein
LKHFVNKFHEIEATKINLNKKFTIRAEQKWMKKALSIFEIKINVRG